VRGTAWNADFSAATDFYASTGTGALASGSQSAAITAGHVHVGFRILNNTGGVSTYLGESGANYLKITNWRANAIAAATVSPRQVIASLVATHTAAVNPTQLSGSLVMINDSGVDLPNETYEDRMPGDIIEYLASLGDTATPANLYEAGVWEDQVVQVRNRNTATRPMWYVDLASVDIEQTIETLRNSAYAVYPSTDGRTLRTDTVTEAQAQQRYGLVRREAIRTQTTVVGWANIFRDVFVNDRKVIRPRASVRYNWVYDAAGNRWPAFVVRAWDRMTIRNLPPIASAEVDRLRTFVVRETSYDALSNMGEAVPEETAPRLALHERRLGAGVVR